MGKKNNFDDLFYIGLTERQAKVTFHVLMNERANVLDALDVADINQQFKKFLQERLADLDIITDVLCDYLCSIE